jgi:hypothetical protein
MTDFRALCARMADELDYYRQLLMDDRRETHALAAEARTALAEPQPPADGEVAELVVREIARTLRSLATTEKQIARHYSATLLTRAADLLARLSDGPAVQSREPASVVEQPSDRELLELMPESMRDEFSYAAKTCSDATGGQVKPRIFRVCLNTVALEYACAVLARWGTPNLEETRSSLAPIPVSERLPEAGDCDAEDNCWWFDPHADGSWYMDTFMSTYTHWLPAHALPLPNGEVE